VVIDQSEAFLALAERRLQLFGDRAACRRSRLQDNWAAELLEPPAAIVSMSAIHHLDPAEKQALYCRCWEALRPGGIFLNADEVRPVDDAAYLAECRAWAAHMHRVMAAGVVPPPMCDALLRWETRNVEQFGTPRVSGDDCHETVEVQMRYLAAAGFEAVDVPWHRELWALLRGLKASEAG
jgi:tRNA (cmo5U34)-methyltransferase